MGFDIFLTIFLVFVNGFFVAAEFAIVKVRTSQVDVKEGSAKATKAAQSILKNLDGYLAATQLGITLASLGLGWIGEDVMTKITLDAMNGLGLNISPVLAHKIALPIAFAIITMLHIVLGELAPKSLAIRKPLSTTFIIALPLRLFFFIFRPFIWVLNNMANVLLRLVGIQPVHEHDIHSEDELRLIVTESQMAGAIEETEKDIIHNVFNLSDRKITSLMTHRQEITWIDVNDTAEVSEKKILENRHSMYPLCEDDIDHVVGFIYSKDLIADKLANILPRLGQIKRPPFYVPETNMAYSVLELFKESRIHNALVVDEFGSVTGIVTINDIFDALVGDISETNEFEYEVTHRNDGSMLVDGQIPFEDFLQLIHEEISEKGNFITLGGFILEQLKKIPKAGDTFTWNNYQIEVVDMDKSRIDKVLVRKVEVPEEEEE